MLWKTSSLGEFDLEARDGAIGGVRDCLFDDAAWTVRWLVIDTGTWLPGRKVLVAPGQVDASEAGRQILRLGLTRAEVRASPPLESDAPVSRHYEERLVSHFGWTDYWAGDGRPPLPADEPGQHGDPHLRSTAEMTGYHIRARDGAIGHVDDFLIDPDGWTVRYLVVDTGDWWPGRQVLVVPAALIGVNWADRAADVDLTREQIRNGPEYDRSQTVDRDWEQRYLDYHGYATYW